MLVSISVIDLLEFIPFFFLDCKMNCRVFVSKYNCMHNLMGSLLQLLRGIVGLRHYIQGVYETLIGG